MGPDPLSTYDVILVNSSAGKDSQAMLDYVAELATLAGVLDRVVVVHADLGRVEWAGTAELAEKQADHYGVRFIKVSRPQGDLLTQIEQRGMFPGMGPTRYCTSDHKRGQVLKVIKVLVDERRTWTDGRPPVVGRRVRVLDCQGMRAAESGPRAKLAPFVANYKPPKHSNGRRQIDHWLPIHHWTADDVWARIANAGTPYHPAYDAGMPRLSCVFCIYAGPDVLIRAAQLNPDLAATYAEVEARIGHSFKADLSMAEVIERAKTAPVPAELADYQIA